MPGPSYLALSCVPPTTHPQTPEWFLPFSTQGFPTSRLRRQEWLPREWSLLSGAAFVSRLLTFTEQPILPTPDLPTDIITISIARETVGTHSRPRLEPLCQAQVFKFLRRVNGSSVSNSSPDLPPEIQSPAQPLHLHVSR